MLKSVFYVVNPDGRILDDTLSTDRERSQTKLAEHFLFGMDLTRSEVLSAWYIAERHGYGLCERQVESDEEGT